MRPGAMGYCLAAPAVGVTRRTWMSGREMTTACVAVGRACEPVGVTWAWGTPPTMMVGPCGTGEAEAEAWTPVPGAEVGRTGP
ncbi:hypothetical protein A176_004931 [Myxococcus hansupus]|uniref:Uncharacterized protein n=1 Tax=Pseudomyxococcus hansupus TaxID=1297742 RepID=A0A0H4WZ01_9BACT|nr:hypothetical protein A176_004931 [Myxococcus hansupus]